MDSPGGLHIREPVRIGRDRETPALIAYGVIVGDDPLLVHTEDRGAVRPDPRDEGGAVSAAGPATRRLEAGRTWVPRY
jgi:hypothetical protein